MHRIGVRVLPGNNTRRLKIKILKLLLFIPQCVLRLFLFLFSFPISQENALFIKKDAVHIGCTVGLLRDD